MGKVAESFMNSSDESVEGLENGLQRADDEISQNESPRGMAEEKMMNCESSANERGLKRFNDKFNRVHRRSAFHVCYSSEKPDLHCEVRSRVVTHGESTESLWKPDRRLKEQRFQENSILKAFRYCFVCRGRGNPIFAAFPCDINFFGTGKVLE